MYGWNLYFDEPAIRQLKIDAETLATLPARERIRILRSSFFKNMDRSRKEIMMGPHFSFPEVFPIVEKVILDRADNSTDYMTHDEIAAAFMRDEAGSKLLDQLPREHSRLWWASNIIAFYSKRLTMSPEYRSKFARKKIRRKWAYKVAPRTAATA